MIGLVFGILNFEIDVAEDWIYFDKEFTHKEAMKTSRFTNSR